MGVERTEEIREGQEWKKRAQGEDKLSWGMERIGRKNRRTQWNKRWDERRSRMEQNGRERDKNRTLGVAGGQELGSLGEKRTGRGHIR